MKISTFIVAMAIFWTVPSLGQQWDIGGNFIATNEWFGAGKKGIEALKHC